MACAASSTGSVPAEQDRAQRGQDFIVELIAGVAEGCRTRECRRRDVGVEVGRSQTWDADVVFGRRAAQRFGEAAHGKI